MLFILLFGIVSMFSDMTKESAESIRGAFLSLMGASAATIGLVSGLGELAGYSLRIVSGRLADRTRKYWPIVMAGYCLELITISLYEMRAMTGDCPEVMKRPQHLDVSLVEVFKQYLVVQPMIMDIMQMNYIRSNMHNLLYQASCS